MKKVTGILIDINGELKRITKAEAIRLHAGLSRILRTKPAQVSK